MQRSVRPLSFIYKDSRVMAVILVVLILSVSLMRSAQAAVGIHKQINFQGKLVNTNGTNVSNGSYSVTFTLYDAATNGNILWDETQNVTVSDGIFRVSLGSVDTTLGNVNFNSDSMYLGIQVGSDSEMTPRIRFSSVPYAFNAEKVNGLTVTNTSSNPFSSTTTLQIGDGKTVVINNGLTFSGTDGTTITFPNANDTVVVLDLAQTLTNKTIGSTGLTFSGATTDITTGTNQDFVISPNGTGLVGINTTSPLAALDLRYKSGTIPVASIAGVTSNATLVVDNSGVGDIFVASSAGLSRFVIQRNGNVGIGVTNPTERLDVVGKIHASIAYAVNGTTGYTGSNLSCISVTGGLVTATGSCSAAAGGSWTIAEGATFPNQASVLDVLIGGTATSSADFAFTGINGSGIPSFVTANGNVGIGTTTPVSRLNITGNSGFQSLVQINQTGTQTNNDLFTASRSGVTQFVIRNDGNVGIGASAPQARLDVRGTTGTTPTATISANSSFAGLVIDQAGSGDVLTASTAGQMRFTVQQNGNIAFSPLAYGTCTALETVNGVLTCGIDDTLGAGSADAVTFEDTTPAAFADNQTTELFNDSPRPSITTNSVTSKVLVTLYYSGVSNTANDSFMAARIVFTNDGSSPSCSTSTQVGRSVIAGFNTAATHPYGGAGTFVHTPGAAGTINYTICSSDDSAGTVTDTADNITVALVELAGTEGVSNWTADTINGILRPNYLPLDVIFGGAATSSAKFALLGMNNSNIPVASVSANTNGRNGIAIAGDGSIQSFRMGTMTIGGSTTGNIEFKPGASGTPTLTLLGTGNIGIGTTTPTGKLNVTGDVGFQSLVQINQTGTQANNDIFTASSAGATRFVINHQGNVGIGSQNPESALHITGNSDALIRARVTNSNGAGSSAYSGLTVEQSSASSQYLSMFYLNSGFPSSGTQQPNSGVLETGSGATNGLSILTVANAPIRFATQGIGNERMRIDGAGNVGIGITSPVSKLDLEGNSGYVSLVQLNQLGTQTNNDLFTASAAGTPRFTLTNAGGVKLGTNEGTNGQCLLSGGAAASASWGSCGSGTSQWDDIIGGINYANGNVGIGVSSPVGKLDIEGNTGFQSLVQINQLGTQISNDLFTASAAGTPRFTITNAGGIKLGTSEGSGGDCLKSGGAGAGATWGSCGTGSAGVWSDLSAPTTNLTLAMDTDLTTFNWATGTGSDNLFSLTTNASANGTGALLNLQTGTSATVLPLRVRAGSTEALTVKADGNIGIGTTDPGAKLAVIGQGSGDIKMGSASLGGNYSAISLNGTLSSTAWNFTSSTSDTNLYINRPSGSNISIHENNGGAQMTISTGGNIGMGVGNYSFGRLSVRTDGASTNSPNDVLSLWGGTTGGTAQNGLGARMHFLVENDDAAGTIYTKVGSITGLITDVTNASVDGALVFATTLNGTVDNERMRLDNFGNLGIGVTSPVSKLDIEGNSGFQSLVQINQQGTQTNNDIFTASAAGTPRFTITNAGGIKLGTSEGSNGNCLKSGGTGAAASWAACAPNAVDGFDIDVFTASSTWDADTDAVGIEFAQIIVTGGGGGGGEGETQDTASEAGGGGGGAGGTTIEMLTAATLGSGTHTVTVGTGGAGATGTNNNVVDAASPGEASSFASFVSANGGTQGAGVSSAGSSGAAGGNGGAATTDGDIELAGGGGNDGQGVNESPQGGDGGGSYWGGGNGGARTGGNVSISGGNGTSFGTGGGGGASEDVDGAASGGTGAAGVVVVMSYTASGADLAEWYDTRGGVEPGDIVAISEESLEYQSFALGLQKTSVLEKAVPGKSVAGVVASIPYEVMGGEILKDAKDPKPVALAGRVPVKVSEENGKIKAGDLLTVSSKAGVAMRSTKAGVTIGRALHDADCQEGENEGSCKVMVLVNTSFSNGMLVKEAMKEDGIDLDSVPEGTDVSRIILAKLIDEKQNILATGSAVTSEITTDTLVAGLEVITPKVVADEVETNRLAVLSDSVTIAGQTVREYVEDIVAEVLIRGSLIQETTLISPVVEADQLVTNVISPLSSDTVVVDGRLVVSNNMGDSTGILNQVQDDIMLDVRGGASVSGSLYASGASISGTLEADVIRANRLDLPASAWAQALQAGLPDGWLRDALLAGGLAIESSENDAVILNLIQDPNQAGNEMPKQVRHDTIEVPSEEALGASDSAEFKRLMDESYALLTDASGSAVSIAGLTVEGKMTVDENIRVKGDGLIEGVLSVVDTLSTRHLFVSGLTQFFGPVIFKDAVTFTSQTKFSNDTAGYVTVRKGQKMIEVRFEKQYESVPVIQAQLVAEPLTDDRFAEKVAAGICIEKEGVDACQEMLDMQLLNTSVRFMVTKKSEKGFTIRLQKAAAEDYTFSWTALGVGNMAIDPKKDEDLARKAAILLENMVND